MDGSFAIKKGFTLLELTVVTLMAGVLLAAVINCGINYVNRAKFQATVREMGAIAQAAIEYYNSSNNPNDPVNPQALAWPDPDASKLGSPYLPRALDLSPFGGKYQLAFANNMVTVSTIIPQGTLIDPSEGSFLNVTQLNGALQISITQSVPNEYSGRLSYDLQYLDK